MKSCVPCNVTRVPSCPRRCQRAARRRPGWAKRVNARAHGVTKVPEIFAAISSAVGTIGKDHGLSITAEEYQAFNRCLDTGVATSIENYWKRERADEDARLAERVGF